MPEIFKNLWAQLPKDTLGYMLLSALAALLVQQFGKPLLVAISRPFTALIEMAYGWLAPRNPFSLALHSYRRHLMRSDLVKIENPVGPSMAVPLATAFAPLKLLSSEAQEGVELFEYAASHSEFIVLGGPGTGKTTLMKSLVTSILSHKCPATLESLIPVFVTLRFLARDKHDVEQAICASFARYHFPGSERFVRSALAEGKMFVILDGLDEVGAARDFVIDKIQEFCQGNEQMATRNHVAVTCRESSYRTEDLRGVIPAVVRVESFSNQHMKTFLGGWPVYKGRRAANLYTALQADSKIRDICRNPLLLTILTGLYLDTDNFELPTSRDRFYSLAVEELLRHRPGRRSIALRYSYEDKRQILERLAFRGLQSLDAQQDPEELARSALLEEAKAVLAKDFDRDELVRELVIVHGIIKQSTDTTYTFSHRTFQEYFAAREANRISKPDEVVSLALSRRELSEILSFYCGLIRNVPTLQSILEAICLAGEWRIAANCLLNMSDPPPSAPVAAIAEALLDDVRQRAQRSDLSLELLSSLSQRPARAFDPARVAFHRATEFLIADYAAAGPTGLVSALAASPEAAAKVIPGLLTHQEQAWRNAAYNLLAATGTSEGLERLLSLVASDNPDRAEIASILTKSLRTRYWELLDASISLPERENSTVWPIGSLFPSRVALPLIEALSGSSTFEPANRAIRNSLLLVERGQTPGTVDWVNVYRDLRLNDRRRRVAFGFRLLFRIILCGVVAVVVAGMAMASQSDHGFLNWLVSIAVGCGAAYTMMKWKVVRIAAQSLSASGAVLTSLLLLSLGRTTSDRIAGLSPIAIAFGPFILAKIFELVQWPKNATIEHCEDILPQGLSLQHNGRYRLRVDESDRAAAQAGIIEDFWKETFKTAAKV